MFKSGPLLIWLSLALAACGLAASERVDCGHAAASRVQPDPVNSDYQIRAAPFGSYEGHFYGF